MRLSAFEQHVKLALEHYHDRDWLHQHSPLAAPYFLGASYIRASSVTETPHWGTVLQQSLLTTALTFWGVEPPANGEEVEQQVRSAERSEEQYHFWVLMLNYFHTYLPSYTRAPLLQAKIYADILHISRATYDRHLHAAIQALGERFLMQMQPTLRPEQPTLNKPLVGRSELQQTIVTALERRQTVALSGVGGSGKTALGVAVAEQWADGAVFWFTLRPTLNDRLPSLLFALGHFLREQGSAGLWQHMVVQRDATPDTNLVLGLIRHDLDQLAVGPLLCFDELDALRPATDDQILPEHQQILEFLNSLRSYVALLLIGQQLVIDSGQHYVVDGLSRSEVNTFLLQHGRRSDDEDVARLQRATGGNPRLLELCLSLQAPDESLSAALDRLPRVLAFHPVLDRIWRRVSEDERNVLIRLSIFRSPAPVLWLQNNLDQLNRLIDRRLIHVDQHGGLFLLPALRHAIYHKLSADVRQQLHLQAAQLRASMGEYTPAVHHYQQAEAPHLAIDIWYPQMEQEIRRGQGWAALQTFQQIVTHTLTAEQQRQLVLIRARLYRLTGEAEKALDDLGQVNWLTNDALTVEKLRHEGFFLQITGDVDTALVKNQEGITRIDTLLHQRAEFLVQTGRIYQRKRDMQNARLTAQRIKYEWERLQGIIEEEAGNVATSRNHLWSALATAESLGDESMVANCFYHLAILEARLMQESSALEYFNKAMSHYRTIGDLYQVERTRSNIAAFYVQLEQYDNVIEPGEAALRYFQVIRHPLMIAAVAANLAEASFYLGNLGRAEHYAELVLRQEEQVYIPYALYTLGMIRRDAKEWQESERYFRRAAHMAEQNEDPYILAYTHQQWALLAMEHGNLAEGKEHLQDSLEMFEALNLNKEVQKTRLLLEQSAALPTAGK